MTHDCFDDVFRLRTLAEVQASDAGWLFKLRTPDRQADADRSGLWWLDRQRRLKRLTGESTSAFGGRWCAGGAKIAFLRSTDRNAQVFALPLDGGEAQQVSRMDDGVASIEDARGERLLVLAHRGARPDAAPYVVEHLPYKSDAVGATVGQSTGLYQLDLDGGDPLAIVDRGGDVIAARWSPDGERIAYVQKRQGLQRHRMDLWLRAREGETRQLTEDLASIGGLAWSPDGRRIAFGGSPVEGSSMSDLYVIDLDDGGLEHFDVELAIPTTLEWAPDGDALLLLQAYRGNQRIARVGLDGAVAAVREFESRQIFGFAVAGEDIAFVAAGPVEGPELWLCRRDGADPTAISDFNGWRRDCVDMHAERLHFDAPDGRGGRERIDGWLLRPRGDGPFPLLLDMHGGPHSLVTFEHETHAHWPVLVRRGWAVLALNPVGTNSYGEAFARRLCGHWGELDWPQWLAAVEALRERGLANGDLAVFGHSYGGFLAAWALTQDAPLACGVVSAGVLDPESHTGTSDTGYYVGPYAMGGEPEQARERYLRQSPVRRAERIRAPTLLLQGDRDQRCPLGQAEELFARLIRLQRARARMVVFPGGTHHVSSTGRPSHRLEFYRQIVDWICEHGGAPARRAAGDRAPPAEAGTVSAERPERSSAAPA